MAPCSRVPGPFHMGTCNNGILFDRYLTGGRKSVRARGFEPLFMVRSLCVFLFDRYLTEDQNGTLFQGSGAFSHGDLQ